VVDIRKGRVVGITCVVTITLLVVECHQCPGNRVQPELRSKPRTVRETRGDVQSRVHYMQSARGQMPTAPRRRAIDCRGDRGNLTSWVLTQ